MRIPMYRAVRYLLLLGALIVPTTFANAQIGVGIGVGVGGPDYDDYGPAPVCSWGYYSYYPYACAPYGYYGPSWFVGGVFIGAGPWYNGYWGRGWGGNEHAGWSRQFGPGRCSSTGPRLARRGSSVAFA